MNYPRLLLLAVQLLAASAIQAQTNPAGTPADTMPSFASFQEAFDAGLTESRTNKNFDKALSDFKVATQLATTPQQKSDAAMYVALTYYNLKDFKNAQTEGEKLAGTEGATPAAVSGVTLMLARIAQNVDKDPEKARILAGKVIGLQANPSHVADARYLLATVQNQLAQKAEAIATLQSLLDDPKSPEPIKENGRKLLEKLNQEKP